MAPTQPIHLATNTLHAMFAHINRTHYKGGLPNVALTIQTKGKHNAYGWCTVATIWESQEDSIREINLSAEYLTRGALDVYATILHECVHLWNMTQGIKDFSRGGRYHNRHFKDAAEAVGLVVTPSNTHGWAHTTPTTELAEAVRNHKSFNKWEASLTYARREQTTASTTRKRTIKHTCPCCGLIARTNVYAQLTCTECDEPMENGG